MGDCANQPAVLVDGDIRSATYVVASVTYETFTISLRPPALARLRTAIQQAITDAWDVPEVEKELVELECEIRARLQRIERGDFQR